MVLSTGIVERTKSMHVSEEVINPENFWTWTDRLMLKRSWPKGKRTNQMRSSPRKTLERRVQ